MESFEIGVHTCLRCGVVDDTVTKLCRSCYQYICIFCYSLEAKDWSALHSTCPKCTDDFNSKLRCRVVCGECDAVVEYKNREAFEKEGFLCPECGIKPVSGRDSDARLERSDVYAFIDSERDFQDDMGKNFDHKGVPSFEAELLLLEQYVKKAKEKWTTSPDNTILMLEVRKIAAISVRCMENHGDKEKMWRTQENKSNHSKEKSKRKGNDKKRRKKKRERSKKKLKINK